MSKVGEKVAYLKGLAEGLGVNGETEQGKLMLAMIDTLEALAKNSEEIDERVEELSEYVEEIDSDVSDLEEALFLDDVGAARFRIHDGDLAGLPAGRQHEVLRQADQHFGLHVDLVQVERHLRLSV